MKIPYPPFWLSYLEIHLFQDGSDVVLLYEKHAFQRRGLLKKDWHLAVVLEKRPFRKLKWDACPQIPLLLPSNNWFSQNLFEKTAGVC